MKYGYELNIGKFYEYFYCYWNVSCLIKVVDKSFFKNIIRELYVWNIGIDIFKFF